MKKRILLLTILAIMLAGGAFAQTHWISFEIKGPGAGLRYEYVITPSFTVGGYISYTYITIPIIGSFGEIIPPIPSHQERFPPPSPTLTDSVEFGATARWYPSGRMFFTEISLGYNIFEYEVSVGYHFGNGNNYIYYEEKMGGTGFCIAPGLGWTIDLGKMGDFFLSPGVKFPITIGRRFNLTVAPYVGLGYAF